ncbi:hypothetical protein ACFFRR_008396 [Megaselia abdita]
MASSTVVSSNSSHRVMLTTSSSTSAVNSSNRISVRTNGSGFNTSTPISSYHHQLREKLNKKEVKEERRSMGEDTDTEAISDSQRSLSEGRLIDSDFNRDGLSQSHDSVFSESATASSLSIVLKAELADVLRKRRNRPDASGSEEDLGLPRSPTTPQRNEGKITNHANHSEVSSLSQLSMRSSELDEDLSSTHYNVTSESIFAVSSSVSSRSSADEIDMTATFPTNRLSHSAARHKMAVRPKKKGPTRHRRTTMEPSHLPSTPELNEESHQRPASLEIRDFTVDKVKSRSLPPGVNAKIIEEHSKEIATSVKRSKTSTQTTTKNNITKTTLTAEKEVKEEENGFFRKYLLRNSKRGQKTADECDTKKEEQKEKVEPPTEDYKQKVEETRKEIRREILSEKSGLSGMLGSFILSQEKEAEKAQAITKPKSSAATRQRVTPKDIKDDNAEVIRREGVKSKARSISESSDSNEGTPKKVALNRSYKEEIFQSTTLVKEITKKEHFDKNNSHQPRIVGLNTFQQKICKSNDSLANSSDSSDLFKGFNNRRRPSVEKSKSFRTYTEKSVEGGFQINDNKLLKQKPESLPLSQGIYTKNIILTTSTSNNHTPKKILSPVSPIANMDISEIEDSIDKIVKAPFITVIRNSGDETTLKAPALGSPLKERLENYEKNFATSPTSHVSNKIRISVNEKVDEQKVEQRSTEQRLTERVLEQRASEKKAADQKIRDDKVSEQKLKEQKVLEQKLREQKVLEQKSKDQKVSEQKLREQKVLEKQLKEQKASEQKLREQKVLEQQLKEQKVLEHQLREQKVSEQKLKEQKASEHQLREQKVSEQKLREHKIEKKVTEKITEKKIVENGKSFEEHNTEKNEAVNDIIEEKQVVLRQKASMNSVSLAPSITRISANFSKKESNVVSLDRRIELSKSSDSLNESSTDVSNGLKAKSNSFNRPRRSSSISSECASALPEFMKIQLNRVDPSRPKSSILMARKCKLEEDGKSLSNESVEITDNDKPPTPVTPEPEREKPKKQVSLEEPLTPKDEKENPVILRKKSFVLNLTQSNSMISVRDDATPELMKVFARRSLKVKDEDIQNMNLELNQSKQVPNVDSDKENQSASDEKLDKLVKNDAENTTTTSNHTKFSQKLDNRTSLSKISNINSLNDTNNNNNGNINNINNVNHVSTTPLRHSANGFRVNSVDERNNNNIVSSKYRHSTAFSPPSSPTDKNSPPCITTPSCEFKGIHQMRAEWEKRAKEAALK